MKVLLRVLIVCIVLLLTLPAIAQQQERFGAAGIGYFSLSRPNIQGWAALGIPITSDKKVLSYTDCDIAVVGTAPQFTIAGLKLQYTIRTGLAYNMLKITTTWSLWGLAAPGLSANGDKVFSNFEYGGFIHKDVGKGWGLLIAFTAEKAGVIATDFAPRMGVTRKF